MIRLFITSGTLAAQALAFAQLPPAVADVPTSAPREFAAAYSELMPEGAKLVGELVPHLKPQVEKDDADAKARFAIAGLVWHTGKHGTAEQKKALGQALLQGVPQANGEMPKNFLLEQLQYTSDPTFADDIAGYLSYDALGNQALRTLLVTAPEGLEAKLLAALPSAPPRTQTGILLALAGLGSEAGTEEIGKFADSDDADLGAAALMALVATGSKEAQGALKEGAAKLEGFYASLVPAGTLAYAEAVTAKGDKESAVAIVSGILAQPDSRENAHAKSAALALLVKLDGEKAMPQLLKAADSDYEEIRVPALRLASKLEGSNATAQLIEKVKSAPAPEVAADAVLALGNTKGPEAFAAVVEALKSENPNVRVAAVRAAGRLDRGKALPALVEALKVDQKEVAAAIGEQFARADEQTLRGLLAGAMEGAGPEGKMMLIDQIARRKLTDLKQSVYKLTESDQPAVRTAAYKALETLSEPADLPRLLDMMLAADKSADKNAARRAYVATARSLPEGTERSGLLVQKYAAAKPEQQIIILDTLPAVGGDGALKLAEEASKSTSPEVKDAAIRSLSEWPDTTVVPVLQKLLADGTEEKHQILAIRGLVAQAAKETDYRKRLALLEELLKAAKRPDERKLVIAGLAEIQTTRSFELVAPFLDQDDVKGEASAAVAKIVLPKKGSKGLESGAIAAALVKAIPNLSDADVKSKAEEHLKKMQN